MTIRQFITNPTVRKVAKWIDRASIVVIFVAVARSLYTGELPAVLAFLVFLLGFEFGILSEKVAQTGKGAD